MSEPPSGDRVRCNPPTDHWGGGVRAGVLGSFKGWWGGERVGGGGVGPAPNSGLLHGCTRGSQHKAQKESGSSVA